MFEKNLPIKIGIILFTVLFISSCYTHPSKKGYRFDAVPPFDQVIPGNITVIYYNEAKIRVTKNSSGKCCDKAVTSPNRFDAWAINSILQSNWYW